MTPKLKAEDGILYWESPCCDEPLVAQEKNVEEISEGGGLEIPAGKHKCSWCAKEYDVRRAAIKVF